MCPSSPQDDPRWPVEVRDEPAQTVLAIRAVVASAELVRFFDEAIDQMQAYLSVQNTAPSGPSFSIWHSGPGDIPGYSDLEVCTPIPSSVLEHGRMRVQRFPASRQAVALHSGPYEGMGDAFGAVYAWLQDHGHESVGPPRDTILVGPRETSDPAMYRTEIAYPIRA